MNSEPMYADEGFEHKTNSSVPSQFGFSFPCRQLEKNEETMDKDLDEGGHSCNIKFVEMIMAFIASFLILLVVFWPCWIMGK